MKVSVYTPSHDPTFLRDAYESLRLQTHEDWEWAVLLNHGAKWTPFALDKRVSVYTCSCKGSDCMNIGALKREAISHTDGPILLELDHDDMLHPGALFEVEYLFRTEPSIGFIYSDFTQVDQYGEPNEDRFSPAYGWEYEHDGRYLVCKGLEAFPSNVSSIHYAPNHLRSFRRSLYDAVGGYDATLKVCDDQDLMSRMYQITGPFTHLEMNLYQQRIHEGNTQSIPETNALIQSESLRLYDLHVERNAVAFAEDAGLLALDMGGAHNAAPGFTVIDSANGVEFDALQYLSKLEANSVGVIRCNDFLEHLLPFDRVSFMNQCHRVLVHGGMLLTRTPSSDGRGAYQDPTHVSFWNENSFWYYTDEAYAKFIPSYHGRFMLSRNVTYFPSQFHLEHNIPYVDAHLVCVKNGSRLGGLLNI